MKEFINEIIILKSKSENVPKLKMVFTISNTQYITGYKNVFSYRFFHINVKIVLYMNDKFCKVLLVIKYQFVIPI